MFEVLHGILHSAFFYYTSCLNTHKENNYVYNKTCNVPTISAIILVVGGVLFFAIYTVIFKNLAFRIQ